MRTAAYGPLKGHRDAADSAGVDLDSLCFFLIAVGYKVPWTAISSLLHQFNQQFQEPRVLLWLNLAYFLPSVPALLLHSSLQDVLEARLGVAKAGAVRFTLGLGSLVVLCVAFPSCSGNLHHLLATTAAVGVAYSIAFGTSHQLAPRFNPRCTVALTTGFVSCGVVVLLADLALKTHAAAVTSAAVARLFQVVAVQALVGLLSALLLLRRHWRRLKAGGGGVGGIGGSSGKQHLVVGLLPPPGPGIALGGSGRQLLLPRSSWEGGGGGSSYAGASSLGLRHTSSHAHQQQQQHYGCGGAYAGQMQTYGYGVQPAYGHSGSSSAPAGLAPSQAAGHGAGGGYDSSSSYYGSSGYSSSAAGAVESGRGHSWHAPRPGPSGSDVAAKQRGGGGLRQRLAPLLLLVRIAVRVWPAWLALLLSVGSSMFVFPLFTYVDTSGSLGERLPQVLFYARLLGDILGRMVPPRYQLKSRRGLLAAAFFKTKLLLVLVPAMLQPALLGGDLPLALLVAANWWLSGYINTGAYLLAPQLVVGQAGGSSQQLGGGSRGRGGGSKGGSRRGGHAGGGCWHAGTDVGSLRAKTGGLMAVAFQASCFVGLMCACALQFMLHNRDHPYTVAATSAAAAAAAASSALKSAAMDAVRGGASRGAAAAAAGLQGAAASAGGAAAAGAPLLHSAGRAVVAAAAGAWNASATAVGDAAAGAGAGVAAVAAAAAAAVSGSSSGSQHAA